MCFRLLAKVLDSPMQKGWREGELHCASFTSSVNFLLFAIICKILVNLATSFNSKVVISSALEIVIWAQCNNGCVWNSSRSTVVYILELYPWQTNSYGYRGTDSRRNLWVLPTGELLYFVAAVAVLYDRDEESQRHYTGHTEDIQWWVAPKTLYKWHLQ